MMIQSRQIALGPHTFDCLVAGESDKPLILFLHGFPETGFMWHKLMESLASQGYYCLAPNLRGYSENACPKRIHAYAVKYLRQDVLGLADVVGKERFHLVGHDWGAAIGWNVVHSEPERILSWTALSVPHTKAFLKAYKRDKDQKKRSRYITWFLLPILPEIMLRKNDFQKFRRLWKHCSAEEINNYLEVFRRKASLRGALNYYRANIGRKKSEQIGEITTPTLFLWGNRDLAIGRTAAEMNAKYMKGPYYYKELEGGHWLIQTNYTAVEEAIRNHIRIHYN